MEATRNAILAQRPVVIRRWRGVAVALALVAALWAGFAVGRVSVSAPPVTATVNHQSALAGMPVVIPTGEPGRVWGHWDSAPRTGAAGHPAHHHRVKWGG
jgi:hypothetical protein